MHTRLILRSLILTVSFLMVVPAAAQKKAPGPTKKPGTLDAPGSPKQGKTKQTSPKRGKTKQTKKTPAPLPPTKPTAGKPDSPPKPPTAGQATEEPPQPASGLILLPFEGDRSIVTLDAEIAEAVEKVGKQVQRSSLPLEDLMLAVGCTTNSIGCLQQIGESVSAGGLILGNTRKAEGGLELTLRWFDVKSGGDSGRALRLLPDQAADRKELLLGAMKELFRIRSQQTSTESTGSIRISATAPYVEVLVNSQPRGALPLEMRDIEVGTYTIEARSEGYITWRGSAEIRINQMTNLEIEMVPSPHTKSAPSYIDAVRTRTWIIGGVGLASLAVGIAVGANVSTTQNSFDKIAPVTPEKIHEMEELKQSGERDAMAANIFYGIGSAALVTAALLSYLDYRRTLPKKAPPKRARLQIGPGSVQLNLSF